MDGRDVAGNFLPLLLSQQTFFRKVTLFMELTKCKSFPSESTKFNYLRTLFSFHQMPKDTHSPN